ncbi:hypothetical protein HMPREF1546_00252 [Oscillibacter sp. KLE 1745]|nr:hypothetical protein HMPREF1546_00252 [Oscillibacter sp. KLE 1745]
MQKAFLHTLSAMFGAIAPTGTHADADKLPCGRRHAVYPE